MQAADGKVEFTPGFYDNLIQKYAEQASDEVSLRQFMERGKAVWRDPSTVIENAQFLHKELPKRLAKRLLGKNQQGSQGIPSTHPFHFIC